MPSHRWGAKDPDEIVNYRHDWGALLAQTNDSVVGPPEFSATCDVELVETVMETPTVQRVKLRGGTLGPNGASVRCHITLGIHTQQGQYFQEGIVMPLREQ